MNALHLGGLSPTQFLAQHWQKSPLLVRRALPGFVSPISPDELAGLACEADVESRLILERDGPTPWTLEHGPFEEQRFGTLPETHWTLLVQECNKYLPELAGLLEHFRFIPNWRVDDVMVSYAPYHGSVGPHLDQYDVFLIQGLGRRRWQISSKPVHPNNFLPDLELRIMRDFSASDEWILEPGDMLYLPPGVAHHGVALEDCITLSVGFRAPSHSELISGFLDGFINNIAGGSGERHYTDPELILQNHPGEISPDARAKIHALLHDAVADKTAIDHWFGRFVTEAKSGQPALLPERPLDAEAFLQHLTTAGGLERSEWTRFAFINHSHSTTLFIDGEAIELDAELRFAAPLLCDHRHYSHAELQSALQQSAFASLLTKLYNYGYVQFIDT
jgi:50S ribosomal protein L16 3-hydroxylase